MKSKLNKSEVPAMNTATCCRNIMEIGVNLYPVPRPRGPTKIKTGN